MKHLILILIVILTTIAPAFAQEGPTITLTQREAQMIMNALAPPAMQMLAAKLQAAQREPTPLSASTQKPAPDTGQPKVHD